MPKRTWHYLQSTGFLPFIPCIPLKWTISSLSTPLRSNPFHIIAAAIPCRSTPFQIQGFDFPNLYTPIVPTYPIYRFFLFTGGKVLYLNRRHGAVSLCLMSVAASFSSYSLRSPRLLFAAPPRALKTRCQTLSVVCCCDFSFSCFCGFRNTCFCRCCCLFPMSLLLLLLLPLFLGRPGSLLLPARLLLSSVAAFTNNFCKSGAPHSGDSQLHAAPAGSAELKQFDWLRVC